jgi:glutaredoxin
MPIRRACLVCLGVWLLACGDSAAPARDPAPAAPVAERPAGWQSLDDEASAQRLYYQFVDERRQVRFVESLDDVPESLRASVGFVKMAVAPPLSPGDARRARNAALAKGGVRVASADGAPRVVLYSAEWCGACTRAKRYLKRRGTQYEERNVDIPAVARELFEKTGERGIPVLEVDGRVLSGFSEALYDDLLDRA